MGEVAACFTAVQGEYSVIGPDGRVTRQTGTMLAHDPDNSLANTPGCRTATAAGQRYLDYQRQQVTRRRAAIVDQHGQVMSGLGGYRTAYDGLMAARGNLDSEHAAIMADHARLAAAHAAGGSGGYGGDMAAYRARSAAYERRRAAYVPLDEAFTREWGQFGTRLVAYEGELRVYCDFIGGRMMPSPAVECRI